MIGPITGRQFIILLVVLLLDFLVYRIFLNLVAILIIDIPITGIGVIFAFARINGQPFHYIVLNMIQTWRKPRVRVWNKEYSDSMLRTRLAKEEEVKVEALPEKAPLQASRLTELSMTVNTGGVYKPEQE